MAISYNIHTDLELDDLQRRLDAHAKYVDGLWELWGARDDLGPFHEEIMEEYARARQFAEDGVWTGTPERGTRARVIAEALSLYEMYRPGHLTLPDSNAADDFAQMGRRLAAQALAALDAGRLEPVDGALSQGWVEVFPELTDDERRLGQLPGFTPERIEQWLETFPIEDLGLPPTTGTPRPDDPTSDVISTPIPEWVRLLRHT